MKKKANYGIDSPAIVAALCFLGFTSIVAGFWAGHGAGLRAHTVWRAVGYGFGAYFLLGAAGFLFYSKVGKLGLRDRLLDKIPWRGDERVLDVGCGRGLLTVGAAHRVPNGSVVGVDVWDPRAVSGNRAESVRENAAMEGVGDRVEAKEGDARNLPFRNASIDVVVSNFVVHELRVRADREQMMREVARVLKPGGHVALVDFTFTDECVEHLRKFGVEAERTRDGFLSFWISALLNFGAVKTYHVVGRKN